MLRWDHYLSWLHVYFFSSYRLPFFDEGADVGSGGGACSHR